MKEQRLTPVPFTEVRIADEFWAPRLEINRAKTIPHAFKMCEETGRIDNFAKAGGLMKGEFRGIYFDDSDVYKNIEAASYSLSTHPDPKLEKYLDDLIAKIAAAQRPDGYINSYYTIKEGLDKRWTNLRAMHELYCGGHMIEAAVAHHRATGKRNLLDVAIKFADHIDSVFGPGKTYGTSGHEEIELALVKLYHLTGQERYFKLSKFFLDQRGNSKNRKLWGVYFQDHMPITEQTEPVGHAVRAMYLYSGMTDVAAINGDPAYTAALGRIWESLIERKMYVTGGIGSRHDGEAFGDDYELPNESAYCETCAAIGNALWNQRMFLLHGDSKYADVVERVIYNGFLSGISLSGDRFFYVNPLASRGKHHRQAWYGCACCPVNVTRFLPSLPGYVYATDTAGVYVNLYAAGKATLNVNGTKVGLTQQTRYPWDGAIKLTLEPGQAKAFDLRLRIPGWCQGASLKVNGQKIQNLEVVKGYARISRQWQNGDTVELDLPMPVQRVKSHPKVAANVGRVALQRGPVVYCFEAVDNGGSVYHLSLPANSEVKAEHRPELLGGVTVLKGKALARSAGEPEPKAVDFLAVPYHSWDNREAGQMAVWMPEDPSLAQPLPKPTLASTSNVSASHRWTQDTLDALNDQVEPAKSSDSSLPRFTWWDHRGSEEFVQYEFKQPQTVSVVEVYWFDDTGRGSCRVPASWTLLYKDGQEWKPVKAAGPYATAQDKYNALSFEPVTAAGLKLVVKLQPGYSGGILEWRVK